MTNLLAERLIEKVLSMIYEAVSKIQQKGKEGD